MARESKLLHHPDKPFRGVILIPLDGIAVVHRELVVEIVVALANGDKCSDQVIARCVLVIKGSLTEPVSE